MKAFYIRMPGLPDEKALEIGLSSIAKSAALAWRKHIGTVEQSVAASWDNRDISRRIQAWFDKGYRLECVEINHHKILYAQGGPVDPNVRYIVGE